MMSASTTSTVTPRIDKTPAYHRSPLALMRPSGFSSLPRSNQSFASAGDALERGLDLGHHRLGQRSEVERSAERLAFVHRPPQEICDRFALLGVGLIFVDEDVGER